MTSNSGGPWEAVFEEVDFEEGEVHEAPPPYDRDNPLGPGLNDIWDLIIRLGSDLTLANSRTLIAGRIVEVLAERRWMLLAQLEGIAEQIARFNRVIALLEDWMQPEDDDSEDAVNDDEESTDDDLPEEQRQHEHGGDLEREAMLGEDHQSDVPERIETAFDHDDLMHDADRYQELDPRQQDQRDETGEELGPNHQHRVPDCREQFGRNEFFGGSHRREISNSNGDDRSGLEQYTVSHGLSDEELVGLAVDPVLDGEMDRILGVL